MHIGLIAGNDAWQYPFFGPRFSRTIFLIPEGTPESMHPYRLMRERGLDGVVWTGLSDTTPPKAAQALGVDTYLLLRN